MNEITKALEALDRIFNYCEEIDLHLPEEEQVGYDMLVDINIIYDMLVDIRETLINQKIGHWIKYGSPRCGEQHYQCTSCGYYINFGQWGELYTKQFKYCPNCGIRMKGENNGRE